MNKTKFKKELSVQGVFGIPNDKKYADEDLRTIMNISIYKFHAFAGQIPDLPEEFAVILAEMNESSKKMDTVMAAWIHATPEDAYVSNLDGFIKVFDLKVIDYLTPDKFEESKVFHPYTNNDVTKSIKIKIVS